jgi:hypothetical protein
MILIPSKEETVIDPMIPWNPQRGDQPTPKLGIPDWAQCMGNSFQSCHNWVGTVYSQYVGMKEINTYTYYGVFENWLNQRKELNKDNFYTSALHVKMFNELMKSSAVPLQAVLYDTAVFSKLATYIKTKKRPAILGTKLTGDGGHIIRVVGYGVDTESKEYFVVSDPYGEYPYKTDNQKKDGHLKRYYISLLTGKVTRMTLLEDTV